MQEGIELLHGEKREEAEHLQRQLREARVKLAATALEPEAQADGDSIKTCADCVDSLERKLADALSSCRSEPLVDLATVVANLPPGSALVEFVKTDALFMEYEPSYAVFVLCGRSIHLFNLGNSAEIDQEIQRFSKQFWGAMPSEAHLEVGLKLRGHVLDPILKVVRDEASHLFLAPDGLLHALNFYTLPQHDPPGPRPLYFLHENYTVSYVPGPQSEAE